MGAAGGATSLGSRLCHGDTSEPQQSNGPSFSPSHGGKTMKDEVTPLSSTAGAEYIGGVKRSKGFASTWNRVEWERIDRHVSSESRPRFVNQDSPGRSQGSWVSSSGEEKAFPHAEGERESARERPCNGVSS